MRPELLALGLVAALTLTASAAVRAERWYQVELVVFERVDADAGGEQFPAAAELPVPERSVELLDAQTASAFAEAGQSRLPVAFAPLAAPALELSAVAAALERAAGYRLLRHVGWRQPSFGVDGAPAVHLLVPAPAASAGPAADAGSVEGFVALQVGRYLHLDVDLLYRGRGVEAPMSEHRRLRLGELNYLDHPLYGLLAAVYPVELPSPSDAGSGVDGAERGGDQRPQPVGATGQLGLDGGQ